MISVKLMNAVKSELTRRLFFYGLHEGAMLPLTLTSYVLDVNCFMYVNWVVSETPVYVYWSCTAVRFHTETNYRKIPKISLGAYIFQRPFLRGLILQEGNLRFKIHWASLTVGSKFTVFALFYFVFEDNFPYKHPGGLYLEGRFNGGFFASRDRGLIFGGAYFRNFRVFHYGGKFSPVIHFCRSDILFGRFLPFTLWGYTYVLLWKFLQNKA